MGKIKIEESAVTQSTVQDIKAFSELAEEILLGGAYKVTKFLGEKRTIKATRKLYKSGWKKGDAVDIVFTLGKPNYEEREAIKRAKKDGYSPVEMIIKMPPKPKKVKNENIPMDCDQEKYRVDCCNEDCGWTGYSTDCLKFKHDTGELFCPECREVVEPVED